MGYWEIISTTRPHTYTCIYVAHEYKRLWLIFFRFFYTTLIKNKLTINYIICCMLVVLVAVSVEAKKMLNGLMIKLWGTWQAVAFKFNLNVNRRVIPWQTDKQGG